MLTDFERRECEQPKQEWQQIVHRAVGDERAEHIGGRRGIAQRDQHERLEHTDAARHVTEHAHELRQREDAEEGEWRQAVSRGEQREQHETGNSPVEQRESDLRGREPR